jgi:hypothetical protein
MDDEEQKQEIRYNNTIILNVTLTSNRVERSSIFSDAARGTVSADPDAIAWLDKTFAFDIKPDSHPSTSQPPPDESSKGDTDGVTVFNLFSTGSGPGKVSLIEPSFDVPIINQRRPHDHYFTDPYPLSHSSSDLRNDKDRKSQLKSVAITSSEIIESSHRPWVPSPPVAKVDL